MTISTELEANILRYYHVEKWRIGTIATQLNVHHSVVTRVLLAAGVSKAKWIAKNSIVEPFIPFIVETLTKFPTLTASRLYQMVCERGYPGGPDHFRYLVSLYRPKPQAEAYLRLRTLPGEQAQVDWGHFGNIIIGKAKRQLMGFVMVLSYSRKIFLRFYLSQRISNFLDGHEAAFNYFKGSSRVILYDNLKAAVLERQGDAIRFNPILLEFAAHYHFQPRPVAVARGNEKGRVERAIRYIRSSFFAARTWTDLNDLNAQAARWCDDAASNRPCPEDHTITVQEAFIQEQSKLLQLPDVSYPLQMNEIVKVGKTPYVRFDLNDYSVPHKFVRKVLTVFANQDVVTIIDGNNIIAKHPRCYDKGEQIEDAMHIKELTAIKAQASLHRGQDRLVRTVPDCKVFLIEAATRGYSLRSVTRQLLQLLDTYGANMLAIAIKEALKRNVPHPNSVRLILDKNCEANNQLPRINIDLPNDDRIRNLVVQPHDLSTYDQLKITKGEKEYE